MKKAAVALLCTVSLSGCALPVGVTVATWAADGVSLLSTQKSLLDHGISYVSGQDCALWRMFTDDEVCAEATDNVIVLADAGPTSIVQGYAGTASYDPVDGDYLSLAGEAEDSVLIASTDGRTPVVSTYGEPWYRQTRNDEYLALMPESFRDGVGETTVRLADSTPTFAPVATEPETSTAAMSAEMPAEPRVPVDVAGAVSDTSPIPSGLTGAPSIEIAGVTENPVAAPGHIEPGVPRPTMVADARSIDAEASANPGRYFVIGSFGVWNNAVRFAARHDDLAAHIHGATVDGTDVYRIVVGPFRPNERDVLKQSIAAAGIERTWTVSVDSGSRVAAWYPAMQREIASLGVQPGS